MSSSYSILHNFSQPLYTPDMGLIQTALSMKQQKLDTNRNKLQSMVDQFGSLDIMRGVDQEYVENRLIQVTELTNKYANGDLSDDGLTRSLQANLSQVIDDNVKNSVLSTKLFRSEQAAWEELKTKKPELYNDTNRAFAMQNAESWMGDENVGVVYRGGGGVKEWDDYQGRLIKELPKIAEDMGYTYETVEGSPYGMFLDRVTNEVVPRDKVEQAVKMIIGEKGMQQVRIDAWGKYDKAPDEDIQARYEGKQNKILAELDDSIKGINTLITAEPNAAKKEELVKNLNHLEDVKKSYTNNSFNTVLSTSGREAVYTSLFADDVIGTWTDMYSYAPRAIKSEIDNNYLETLKWDESRRRWETEMALKIAKHDLDTAKAGKTAGDERLGQKGNLTELDSEAEQPAPIRAMRQADKEAFDILQNLSGEDVTARNRIINALKGDWRGEKTITVQDADGNDVIIDVAKNKEALGKIERSLVQKSQVKKDYEAATKRVTDALTKDLVKSVQGGGNVKGLTNFGLRYNEKGIIEETKEDPNAFNELMKKKASGTPLKDHEEKTLKMLTNLHYIADPNANADMRYQALLNLRQEVTANSKDGINSMKKLPHSIKEANRYTQLGKREMNVSLNTSDLATDLNIVKNIWGEYKNWSSRSELTQDLNISALGFWDRSTGEGGYKTYIKSLEKGVIADIERKLMDMDMEISQTTRIYTKASNGKTFEELKGLAGAPKDVERIEISRELGADKKPTGKVNYTFTTGTGAKAVTASTIESINQAGNIKLAPLSVDALQSIGIEFGSVERASYNANYGKNAPSVNIGRMSDKDITNFTPDILKAVQVAKGVSPTLSNEVIDFVARLDSPNSPYNFKIEANEETGTYHTVIYDDKSKKVYSHDMGRVTLSNSEVDGLTKDEKSALRYAAVSKYVENKIGKSLINAQREQSREELNQLYQR